MMLAARYDYRRYFVSAAVAVAFAAGLVPATAEAKQKVGTVKYDKNNKPYCKFKDGTFIDPPFVATTNKDGSKSCHAKMVAGGTWVSGGDRATATKQAGIKREQ